ncbi:AP2 domain-containing protein [Vibrio phage vB_VpaM_R16F]|nr:AP2 domain-containing protein [Vibrio phage vB_VpaM_R16F]
MGENKQKHNMEIFTSAVNSQPHVKYLYRSTDKLVNSTKIFLHCEVHGERTATFRQVKGKGVLCTRCTSRTGYTRRYNEGDILEYQKGSYTIVSRSETHVEIFNNAYPERGSYEVPLTTLSKGNFWFPFDPINNKLPCYVGTGKYDSVNSKEAWSRWYKMHERCYDPRALHNIVNYSMCSVSEDWWCFQNYAEWYNTNNRCVGIDHHVDKDILIKGNKLYSPNTCTIVPSEINVLLTNRKNHRGKYPVGVYYKKKNKKFCVQCSDGSKSGRQTYLGLYSSIEEAFHVYKDFKEKVIKRLSTEYKEYLDPLAYTKLCNYEVTMED